MNGIDIETSSNLGVRIGGTFTTPSSHRHRVATSPARDGNPKPAGPPPGYPERGWPLWFVGYAFVHTRRVGGLFTLGLLLNALLPIRLPWL
jgi:hypothetical protein